MASLWNDITNYWAHVRRHYFNLVVGIVLALLAFASSITGLIVPAWVFWILAIAFLVVAQFRTYLDIRHELNEIRTSIEAQEARRKRLMEARVLTGETFSIWELLVPGQRPLIHNREFIDCTIKGPAIIAPMRCTFNHPMLGNGPIESVLYELVPGERQGLIAFVDCTFLRARFEAIGYYGDEKMLNELRQAPVI